MGLDHTRQHARTQHIAWLGIKIGVRSHLEPHSLGTEAAQERPGPGTSSEPLKPELSEEIPLTEPRRY